jgi:hypothetical protein
VRYITIMAGPTPSQARPVLTVADPALVAELERLLSRRIAQAGADRRERGRLVALPQPSRPGDRPAS